MNYDELNSLFSPKSSGLTERKAQKAAKNGYYPTYVPNPLVQENVFLSLPMEERELPEFSKVKHLMPDPFWSGHESAIECYWKAWELAFGHLRQSDENNGFVANYIDTAFNDCIFMWDSCFIAMFAKYGQRAFSFQRTLDNFYCKQHDDGFICRQISETDGEDRFHRFDPTSTGPNVMAWAEWEYYLVSGDKERLKNVFPVLAAYHRWLRAYRTWPDGTYWSSGWGCGMDNQPRLPIDMSSQAEEFYHGHLVWVDTCLQQALSAARIADIAEEIGRGDAADFREEAIFLSRLVNEKLWDENTGFYHDLRPDGKLLNVKSIGAYWALLAAAVPAERMERFVGHLENEAEFNRPHRIPSLSADHPKYKPEGDYWKGSVWMPTNYMVLRGLSEIGYDQLAFDIAANHVQNIVEVYKNTGTVWENYSPEAVKQGYPAKPDFVGWSGLGPISIMFEYVFGLRADVANSRLVWDVRLLEEHGVRQYPFGTEGVLELSCGARKTADERPVIKASGSVPVELVIRWAGGEEKLLLTAESK